MAKDIFKKAGDTAAAVPESSNQLFGVLPMLHLGRAQKWINRAAVALTAINFLRKKYEIHKTAKLKTTILRFKQTDTAYQWIQRWVRALPEARQAFDFDVQAEAASNKESIENALSSGPVECRPRNTCSLTPSSALSFSWRGHLVRVESVTDSGSDSTSGTDTVRWIDRTTALTIWTRDKKVIDELIEDIISKGAVIQKHTPYVRLWSAWHGWSRSRPCPEGRHVILPDGQYEDVLNDVKDFMGKEEWYRSVGVPWRRGYLLHGCPGSGKTSTVLSVAGDLQLEVCVLSLTDINNETLLCALSQMPERALLVIEDIDAAFSKREGNEASKLTFSELINAIDGAATPEGRILFLSTNHREQLDPALIRPGRVDREIEFTTAGPLQILELANRFQPGLLDLTDAEKWANERVSMATAQERLLKLHKQHNHETPDPKPAKTVAFPSGEPCC